jgi:hypothetical protein
MQEGLDAHFEGAVVRFGEEKKIIETLNRNGCEFFMGLDSIIRAMNEKKRKSCG